MNSLSASAEDVWQRMNLSERALFLQNLGIHPASPPNSTTPGWQYIHPSMAQAVPLRDNHSHGPGAHRHPTTMESRLGMQQNIPSQSIPSMNQGSQHDNINFWRHTTPPLAPHPHFTLDPALATPPASFPVHASMPTTASSAAHNTANNFPLNVANTPQPPYGGSTITTPLAATQITQGPLDRHASAQAKRAASRRPGGGIHDQNESAAVQKEYEEMVNGLREDLKKGKSALSMQAYRARLKLMELIMKKFREVCGVPTVNDLWPTDPHAARRNKDTGELLLSPDFEKGVDDPHNIRIFRRLALLLWTDLKDLQNCPPCLAASSVYWSKDTIEILAKGTFRTLKRDYSAQIDESKRKKRKNQQRNARRKARRTEKVKHRLDAVSAYKERHDGLDPTPLLIADHMSDDRSGPEDDNEDDASAEAKAQWRRDMTVVKGLDPDTIDDSILRTMRWRENVEPLWRTVPLTDIYLELDMLSDMQRPVEEHERHSRPITIRGTGCTSDRAPMVAPYNFGIDRAWYDAHRALQPYRIALRDWYQYPAPQGFEALDAPSAAVQPEENISRGGDNGRDGETAIGDDGTDGGVREGAGDDTAVGAAASQAALEVAGTEA